MPEKTKMKVGVIGAGVMGFNHARVYSELPGAELIGVFDANTDTSEKTAERLKTKSFSSLDELLNSDVKAVTIAVPTSLHKAIALEAFKKGKHILIEKPIAGTLEDAKEIIAAAEKAGKKLMVGHIERFNPVIQAIKNAIQDDEIIAINIVRVGPLPPRIKDVGIIVDLGVHDIDIVRYLSRHEVKHIHCVTSSNVHIHQHEDIASLLLDLGDGMSAQITTNWITPYKSREIQVITRQRFLRGNLMTQQLREYRSVDTLDQSFLVRDMYVRYEEPLKSELKAFIECIRNNTQPLITGKDGYEALNIAIKALELEN